MLAVAADVRTGRLEAQCLVDRPVHQGAVLVDLAALIGMVGENLCEPADQPTGGLIARPGDDLGVVQHLLAGELARLAVLVRETQPDGGLDVLGKERP